MSSSETTAEQREDRRAPLTLWRAVSAFLTTLFHLFGAPEELASRHTLTLKQHALILPWLRAAEALLRRMLFIEAALAPIGPLASIRAPRKRPALRRRRLTGFDPEHPEHWRVSFRCFDTDRLPAEASAKAGPASRETCRQAAGGPKFRSAWPLAERMEALLRVCNDPAPCATRLARRLRKRSALVERIRTSWEDFRDLVGRDLHDALIEPTGCAARVFVQDSS